RHQPLVLDDVDGLYADRQGIRLLKALGQTEGTKTLSWQSAAPALARHDLPRQFTTTSRVPGCPSVFPQQVSFNVCGRIARLPAVVRWTGVAAGPRGLAAACAGRASDRREPGRRESPGGSQLLALPFATKAHAPISNPAAKSRHSRAIRGRQNQKAS